MKRSLFLALSITFALGAQEPRLFTGVITDSMCARNHAAMKITPVTKCVTDCIQMGKSVRYALDDGKNLYLLSDQKTPRQFAARKVRIKGVLFEKTKIIQVEAIEAVR